MKNRIVSTSLVIFFAFVSVVTSQNINDGLYRIINNYVLVAGDTTFLYERSSITNIYDFSKISYDLKQDSSYTGTGLDSTEIIGTWHSNETFVNIDGVENEYEVLSSTDFIIKSPFYVIDSLGNDLPALSILHFSSSTTTNTITKNKEDYYFQLSPSPASESLTLFINSPNSSKGIIEIRNTVGQLVFHRTEYITFGDNLFAINLDFANNGLYSVLIRVNDAVLSQRIYVVK